MDKVPTGSILLLVLVDVALVETMSAVFGAAVARAAGKAWWLGALVGLIAPVVGPLVWAVVAFAREPGLARVARRSERPRVTWAGAAACGLAAALFLVSTPLNWGEISGNVQSYALATDASPADTGVGLIATVGSAIALVAALAATLFSTSRVRTGMVAGFVAGAWLLITLDGLIVFSALGGLSDAADGLSGGRAAVVANPSAGLWVSLVAALVALLGSMLVLHLRDPVVLPMGTAPTTGRVAGPPAVTGWSAPPAAPPLPTSSWGDASGWGAAPGVADPPSTGTPHQGWGTTSDEAWRRS